MLGRMLDLVTTADFAAWFSRLSAAPAEDVATTLEVIVQLGTRADVPESSDALLWYEHPSVSQLLPRVDEKRLSPELVKFVQDWGHFQGYVRRVVGHLESKPVLARVAKLSGEDAAGVSTAVERIKRLAKTRLLDMSEFRARRPLRPYQAPSPYEAGALARFVDVSEVREAYLAALTAAGFEAVDLRTGLDALREITLRSTPPGLRLLYGIDEKRNRGLVVLGEWLDRSFYGDSVRRAEALWAQFLDGRPLSTQPVGVR
jgi:hypothetical protein